MRENNAIIILGLFIVFGILISGLFQKVTYVIDITKDGQNLLNDYALSDIDSTNGYKGYIKSTGEWYISKENSTAIRYITGLTNYTVNWDNRSSLTYTLFNETKW